MVGCHGRKKNACILSFSRRTGKSSAFRENFTLVSENDFLEGSLFISYSVGETFYFSRSKLQFSYHTGYFTKSKRFRKLSRLFLSRQLALSKNPEYSSALI